jgi:hemerythrin
MAYIKWTDELSVQIPSIDAEHKTLIGIINEFYDGIDKKYTAFLVEKGVK